MTLDQFINHLCSLADHYNAGDFTVKIDAVKHIPAKNLYVISGMTDVTGDDFCLDLENGILDIHAKQL